MAGCITNAGGAEMKCVNARSEHPIVLHVAVVMIATFVFHTSVYAEDKGKTKSELMALVGMRIPPDVPFRKQAELPGWHALSSIHVASIKGHGENGYIGNEGGFVITHRDNDMTRTVLDARVLPLSLLGYDLKDGKLTWRKDAYRKYSVEYCKKAGTELDSELAWRRNDYRGEYGVEQNEKAGTEEAIIGLVRPEPGKAGCLHYSGQVKMAWRVNGKTGKLEDISPKGLHCLHSDGEDECY